MSGRNIRLSRIHPTSGFLAVDGALETINQFGIGSDFPDANLHVEGNVYASSNLEVGQANLFVDTTSSRVGVGTRDPDATLHVEGNAYVSSNLEVGQANLFVDTQTSRVGVGTRDPDATLHVEGNAYVSSNLDVGVGGNISYEEIPGTLEWATQVGGSSVGQGHGISVDKTGNVYVTGNFVGQGIIKDVNNSDNDITFTSQGIYDAFVAKYSSSGTLEWATQIGGTSSDFGYRISADTIGSVYVTGRFGGDVTIKDVDNNNNDITLTSQGTYDAFIAKYSSSGTLEWATQIGGTGNVVYGYGISADTIGSVYVTGYFDGQVTVKDVNNSNNDITLLSQGDNDVFIAKYSSTGTLEWATQVGGSSFDQGHGISVDKTGNVYVIGYFEGQVTIKDTNANTDDTTLTSQGGYDTFVAKYSSSGTLDWATQIGGTNGNDFGQSISADTIGSVYVTGRFGGDVTIKDVNNSNNDITLTSQGSFDAFVAKYSSSGTLEWATQVSGTSSDYGQSISADIKGNVYIIGHSFGGQLTVKDVNNSNNDITLLSQGGNDAFVAQYDTNGNAIWAAELIGTSTDFGYGISAENGGVVYVTGYFTGQLTIKDANGNTNDTTLTGQGSNDAYIIKFKTDRVMTINSEENVLLNTNGGNIGIGTLNPVATLHVEGNAYVSGEITGPGRRMFRTHRGTLTTPITAVNNLRRVRTGVFIGEGYYNYIFSIVGRDNVNGYRVFTRRDVVTSESTSSPGSFSQNSSASVFFAIPNQTTTQFNIFVDSTGEFVISDNASASSPAGTYDWEISIDEYHPFH